VGLLLGLAALTASTSSAVAADPAAEPLTPATPMAQFGAAVAVSGRQAVVGAPISDGTFVFARHSDGTWHLQSRLTPPGIRHSGAYGSAVAISGSTAYVSEPYHQVGAVWVFQQTGKTWSEQAKIPDPARPESGHQFGSDVAASGNTLLVGAVGNAYVYVSQNGRWRLQTTLSDPNPTAQDRYGVAVALDGDTAVVGGADDTSVYTYTRTGTTWSLQQTLTPPGVTFADAHGPGLALVGATLAVGANDGSGNDVSGSVYVYRRSKSGWKEKGARIDNPAPGTHDFGTTLGILSDGTLAIGSPLDNGLDGAIYLYRYANGWSQTQELTVAPVSNQDGLGEALAASGSTLVAGAPGSPGGGAAYAWSGF
jgi:hypothetical protein